VILLQITSAHKWSCCKLQAHTNDPAANYKRTHMILLQIRDVNYCRLKIMFCPVASHEHSFHLVHRGLFCLAYKKVKVKCTLVQALRLSTGRTVHRRSRGIALL
jgi:hypothetical protein